jgi:hypothetical protein
LRVEGFGWCGTGEALAGLFVDLFNDGGQLVSGQVFEAGAFRQVASDPAVEMFVRAATSRTAPPR